MKEEPISSLQNPKVKLVHKLWERRQRDKTNCFLVEGFRELSFASTSNFFVETLFICPALFLGDQEEGLIQKFVEKGTQVFHCTEKVFRSFSYRDRPDGLLGIAQKLELNLNILKSKNNPFYLVAEAIEKPGNLGTILRSSDATGVDGVIVCDKCTDIYNPNVVRASIGTLFTVPVVEAGGDETLHWLRTKKVKIIAATPEGSVDFTEADLTGPIAIVVGTEQYGLSSRWRGEADLKVRIPMLGKIDSLNVSVATTLLLYEVLRQRKA